MYILKGRRGKAIRRKAVAELAGVSEATVSRVLNGVGPIKEATRQRVLEAARQLNYVPSALARQFARSKSGNLGVVLPLLPKVNVFSTYYFSEILSGIGYTAKQCGYDLLLLFREPDEPREYSRLFQTQKVDVCIILGAQDVPEERAAIAELQAAEHPFCLINQRFDGLQVNSVDADHRLGSFKVTAHLLERGRSRIIFLNGPDVYSNSVDRLAGFRQALAEAGREAAAVMTGNYSRKSGYALAARCAAMIRAGEADAIIAANDRMAIGLQQGLEECGLRAGTDYALAGGDDSEGARLMNPPLTSLAVPFFEMGREAASRLLAGLEQEERQEAFDIRLAVKLVVRASS
ncbi:LacI family DNA-binding transcriptional regulator [Paenibacillus sp. GCM10027626]|uniref:LacI family DNA-binding transcriptional regulator n=1 Tax=Paenibacillus sp. GCM10027626 TaxID=3273411 RepID=UPI0036336341